MKRTHSLKQGFSYTLRHARNAILFMEDNKYILSGYE